VKLYGLRIWPLHSQCLSEQKRITNFGEKGAWAHPGAAQFLGTPIMSGRGKATNFKFCTHIYSIFFTSNDFIHTRVDAMGHLFMRDSCLQQTAAVLILREKRQILFQIILLPCG